MTRCYSFIAIIPVILLFFSCATLKNSVYIPSDQENINAVKEVMHSSTFNAINLLANSSQEGLIALIPGELQPVITTLKTLGLGEEINKLDKKVEDISYVALVESEELFKDAITEIEIKDAVEIIKGKENAASVLLKNAMYETVSKRYAEHLDFKLSKIDETKHWNTAVGAYNLFAKNKIEGTLGTFLSRRAVDAIFAGLSKEEAEIRKNPAALGKDIVTRVFNYHMAQKG